MNTLRFSLFSDEQEDQLQAERDDQSVFRRPERTSLSSTAPRMDVRTEPFFAVQENDAASQDAAQWMRPQTDASPSRKPSPLPSVMPIAISPVRKGSTVPAPKPAPVIERLPEQKLKPRPQKHITISMQPPAAKPESEQTSKEKSASGRRKLAWTAAAAAVLLVAVICVDRYLMPELRYKEARQAEAAGNYEQASVLFSALGDYRDSVEHLARIPHEKALSLMNGGSYQEALNLLEEREQDDPLIADCLYALGVMVYNSGDPETGLRYVAQLQDRFPSYDGTAELEQLCCYSLGGRYQAEASGMAQPEKRNASMEKAINAFRRAGDYADAQNRVTILRYRLARYLISMEDGRDLEKAVDLFDEIRDYRDSAERRLETMYAYVNENYMQMMTVLGEYEPIDEIPTAYFMSYDNATLRSYLEELAANDYADAQSLLDRLNGVGFSVSLSYGEEEAPLPDTVSDLDRVNVHFTFPDSSLPLQPCLYCMLPDGNTGLSMYWGLSDDAVTLAFSDLARYDADSLESGEITIAIFDGQPLYGDMLDARALKDAVACASFQYDPTPEAGG